MNKEILNRLRVGERGGEMITFHKKPRQEAWWRLPVPGVGHVSRGAAPGTVAADITAAGLRSFGHCLWFQSSMFNLLGAL